MMNTLLLYKAFLVYSFFAGLVAVEAVALGEV